MQPAISFRNASDLLLNNSHDWEREKLDKFYGMMHETALEQIDLLKTLEIWTQTLTGRYYYRPTCFDIDHFLIPVIDKAKELAEAKGVEFEADITEYTSVIGDIEIVKTVVGHLLSNGVKYTAKGGKVVLAISGGKEFKGFKDIADLEQFVQSKHSVCTVSVTDTGVGMSVEQIASLYNLDSSAYRAGTDGETGYCLGLIICRELLKLHGSELKVESEEGKGSRFWFEF